MSSIGSLRYAPSNDAAGESAARRRDVGQRWVCPDLGPACAGLAVGFGSCCLIQDIEAHRARSHQPGDHVGKYLPGCLNDGGTCAQDLQHCDLRWCERTDQPIDGTLGETNSRTGSRHSARDCGQKSRRDLRCEAQPVGSRDSSGPRARPAESESDLFDPGR